ncbi:MAG: TIGR00374 family protein [Azospirillum sp.]|nr:TIGR00374 family protein [Azospirillum sp.]
MIEAGDLPAAVPRRVSALGAAAGAGLVVGVLVLVGLVAWQGVGALAGLFAAAGPALLLVCLAHLPPVFANAMAWAVLLRGHGIIRSRIGLFLERWLADSINALLPVAQIGGEVVRGRRLAGAGVGAASAAASVLVDLTLGLATLIVFILAGLGLVALRAQHAGMLPMVAGTALFAGLLWLFYRLQRSDLLTRLAGLVEGHAGGAALAAVSGGALALQAGLGEFYRRPGPLWCGAVWRMAGWLGGAAEVWVALTVLGHPVGVVEAVILESLGQLFRNAGFAIPGGLGVQEGGMVVAGGLIGLPAEVALAVALVKRFRDLVLGVPALLAWQWAEGRGAFRCCAAGQRSRLLRNAARATATWSGRVASTLGWRNGSHWKR